jgi:FkbM family methyltransferase
MYVGVKKFVTLHRVYQNRGVKGVISAVFDRLGMWRRQSDPWGIGKLFGASENTVNLDGCRFSINNAAISSDLKEQLLLGKHEKPERTAIKQFLDPRLPVVELGACLGVVSCLTNKRLQDPQKHVVVEANPDLLQLLEENRARNSSGFTILHRVLAYGNDSVRFYVDDSIICSSLSMVSGRAITVQTITLKEILDSFAFRRCTLICDIEGAEVHLFEHEADVIRDRVDLLIIEVHETLLGKKPVDAMLAKLKQMGFTIAYRNWETYVFRNSQGDLRAAENGQRKLRSNEETKQ